MFDRHPQLRVVFLEAGAGWVPFFIDRLHEHYQKRGNWVERGWRDVLGTDFIMFASDYPHWDGEWPQSTKPLRTRTDISDEARVKLAG